MTQGARKLVTIVTPVFNGAETIQRTADSVVDQSYRHIEYLLVDDGSTDSTPEILEKLAEREPRARIISQDNAGRSAARNTGLRSAAGSHVLFLDADDTLSKTCIEELAGAANSHPEAVLYCDYTQKHPSGAGGEVSTELGAQSVFEATATRCPFAIHGCLAPTELLRTNGGFDTSLTFAEDWDLWQRLGRAGVDFVRLPRSLVTYELGARSISSDQAHLNFLQACSVMARCFEADNRVPTPAPEYADGLAPSTAGAGPLGIWLWFAGIELAQRSLFEWLAPALDQLHADWPSIALEPDTAADVFVSGLQLGRGSGWEEAGKGGDPFARLLQYSQRFEAENPTQLVCSQLQPGELPRSISDIHHRRLSWITDSAVAPTQRGWLQLWRPGAKRFRSLPRGVYDLGDIDELDINLFRGAARQARRVAIDTNTWLSAPRRLRAISMNPRLLRQTLLSFLSSAIDLSVHSTTVLQLDRAPATRTVNPKDVSEFEKIFWEEDPWGYDKPYEARKYNEAIELVAELETPHQLSALEIGCAEGHFTRQLAPLVKDVTALDISPTALARLEKRMKDSEILNVETAEFDVRADTPRGPFDLIVCSEVLYYLPESELHAVVDRLVRALRPGGHLVHAHAFEASERGRQPGFGWRQPFGAVAIAGALAKHPELQLERSIESDLYVVERHVRSAKSITGQHEFRPIDRKTLEADIANQVLWSGYQTTPSQAASYQTPTLPVLAYHSIGNEAPPELRPYQITPERFADQLRWLRENGYRSATTSEISDLVRRGRPIRGKAVAITFDDAYRSFGTEAWPLLKAHGFGAILFVPAGHIGEAADWDARYGTPMELLDAESLHWLSNDGVELGSHFDRHRPLHCLTTDELITGFQKSRADLEHLTGREVRLLAYPYGIHNQEIARLAGYCGYELGFTTAGIGVQAFDPPLSLGRTLVDGEQDPIQQLIAAMEPTEKIRFLEARSQIRSAGSRMKALTRPGRSR